MVYRAFFTTLYTVDSVDPKRVKFEWDEKCEQSFQELKNRLITAPVLTLPTTRIGYVVFSDVSRQSLRCVLMQCGMVIAYASCQKHEVNYPTLVVEVCRSAY